MILTAENYFSKEAEMEYFGATQFKNFRKCEAMTMARINGEWEDEKTTALLVGSYVDAHFEKTSDIFMAQNPEIFTRSGDLKSDYKKAEEVIARIERDPMFVRYMSGEKQVIFTKEWLGHKWKIKIDSYHPKTAIVDLKVMRDFDSVWIDGQGKILFVEAWGYDIQAAIYQAVEGNDLPFIIAAATKEKEPDIGLFEVKKDSIEAATEIIKAYIDRFAAVKSGAAEPIRCEKCDYCKHTKKLTRVMDYRELGGEE